MDNFETYLKRQTPRPLPESWRMELLAAARKCRDEAKLVLTEPRAPAREHPWWLAWLWPSPYAWGTLAAAWGLILTLNALSTPDVAGGSAANVSLSAVDYRAAFATQQHQLKQLFRGETEPARPSETHPSPSIPGAWVLPRQKTSIA